MKAQRVVSLVVAIGLVVFAGIWYGRNNHLLPLAAGLEALVYDRLFDTMIGIAFAVFLVIESLLLFAVLVFRQRRGDMEDGPAIEENLRLEIVWTAIPIVIVLWLSIYSTLVYNTMVGKEAIGGMISHHHAPTKHGATYVSLTDESMTQVDVTAMQFAWLFNYPGTEITAGELHVPAGKKVHLNLNAADVIHAFWVPELRLKQDAIPGMVTQVEFTPTKPGTYPIVCTELCGPYHGAMRADLIVETPEDFANWLKEQETVTSTQSPTIAQSPEAALYAQPPHSQEAMAVSHHLSMIATEK